MSNYQWLTISGRCLSADAYLQTLIYRLQPYWRSYWEVSKFFVREFGKFRKISIKKIETLPAVQLPARAKGDRPQSQTRYQRCEQRPIDPAHGLCTVLLQKRLDAIKGDRP
ncbi:hypothetical protein O77CONTIG1_04675 [Leptolyngbya sp. O-77]|nr:hypothetical protein O77CONTIG1_04675 [Leptolyngbya sp. O-77]